MPEIRKGFFVPLNFYFVRKSINKSNILHFLNISSIFLQNFMMNIFGDILHSNRFLMESNFLNHP